MIFGDFEIKFCLWPDGTWCYPDELEVFLSFKSDDFAMVDSAELTKRTGETL